MSLPNYSPSGKILFGSVPWDNGYTNVRLYTNLTDQYNDIVSRMTLSSTGYKYIGRNRTLDVSIAADRMYHCNYCMYKNESLTDGWIYCFITDVQYINDHTSRITLETDVFQTYLYNVDWTIPACFIERETVPSESTKYLVTNEPDFSLDYRIISETSYSFSSDAYVVIVTSETPTDEYKLNIENWLNKEGWSAVPAKTTIYKGNALGANFYVIPQPLGDTNKEALTNFLNHMTWAGASDAIIGIFTAPTFAFEGIGGREQIFTSTSGPDSRSTTQRTFEVPSRGSTVDGYSPHNAKLLYYPYTYCKVSDGNCSSVDLKYELLDDNTIAIKYTPSLSCQCAVLPVKYAGTSFNFDFGFVTKCGTQGTWNSDQYGNWLAQNAGKIALSVVGVGLAAYTGGASLASATAALSAANTIRDSDGYFTQQRASGLEQYGATTHQQATSTLGGAAAAAGGIAATLRDSSMKPSITKGQANQDLLHSTGLQGVRAFKYQVRSELAQQIDEFFDRWGYSVSRIESVNITSRPSWNYVKTSGAAAKSYNSGAGSSAPFSRGRGTPAAALAIINKAFDSGVTFWHTTSSYGNFNLDNSL